MIILLFFAFIVGIVTTLSPCILPVLPLLLAAGIGQGRYRPHAIVIGLVTSFTFFTLTLTALVHILGISPDSLRYISITLIVLFGLTMIFPAFAHLFERFTAPLTRFGSRTEQTFASQNGIASGFTLGCALGLVCAPCAGPILASITTLAATGTITLTTVLLTLFYSIGTALPMFFIMYGGNKIINSISFITPYTQYVRKVFGMLMIIGALAILFHADVLLQQITIKYFPTVTIEDNALVKKELELLQTRGTMNSPEPAIGAKAPEIIGISAWLNSPPLTIEQLKGKVVLIDFWTYSCINCVRTLPSLKKWYQTYKDNGFIIVGVHTPEFAFEHELKNVENAIERFGITYPVALDNHYQTWQNYHNRYWPAHYLLDQQGIIRFIHFGEGEYDKTENMIRSLLRMEPLAEKQQERKVIEQTPEIYLGYERARHYTSSMRIQRDAVASYSYKGPLVHDEVDLKGTWLVAKESITSKDDFAQLDLNCTAQHVYLVMSAEKPSLITVLVDNQEIPSEYMTKDMNAAGQIMVKESRMYSVLDLPATGRHIVTLQVPGNVSLYAFTFGVD